MRNSNKMHGCRSHEPPAELDASNFGEAQSGLSEGNPVILPGRLTKVLPGHDLQLLNRAGPDSLLFRIRRDKFEQLQSLPH